MFCRCGRVNGYITTQNSYLLCMEISTNIFSMHHKMKGEGTLAEKIRRPRYAGHPYDSTLKLLMEDRENEVIPQLLPEAQYIETLNVEVLRDPLRVDRVYRVWYRRSMHILHLEFETDADGEMATRLLEYHTCFLRKYQLPVLSLIVYPFSTTVVESPLEEKSGRETILTFHFRTLCLWKLSAERYVRERIFCMYSLLPTMRGAGARLLINALDEMAEYYKGNDLRLSGELFRFGLLLRRAERILPDEKRQVEERLSMWDNLIEQDPKVRQMRAESELIGEARGVAQGIAAMQSTVLDTLEERFPQLATAARADVERITSLESLRHLIMEIVVARDEAAARRAIDAHLPA